MSILNLDDIKTKVDWKNDQVKVVFENGNVKSFERLPFPEAFVTWQSKARLKMFERLHEAGAGAVRSQPAHLPVLVTQGAGLFPMNLASRGIGLLPKPEFLEKYTNILVEARKKTAEMELHKSLPIRVNAIRQFYAHVEDADEMILGGLEIFEGTTAKNIFNNPMVSLLFTGEPPQFPSYQFNGVMEILLPSDERFKFLLAARELFAFDVFHVRQQRYPFGYAFHLVEVLEKTPFPRR